MKNKWYSEFQVYTIQLFINSLNPMYDSHVRDPNSIVQRDKTYSKQTKIYYENKKNKGLDTRIPL